MKRKEIIKILEELNAIRSNYYSKRDEIYSLLSEKDLVLYGDKVGDSLSYPFLREKRLGKKRIYYLVYKEIAIILLVEASDKKLQQETINHIKLLIPEFKEIAYQFYEKLKKTN